MRKTELAQVLVLSIAQIGQYTQVALLRRIQGAIMPILNVKVSAKRSSDMTANISAIFLDLTSRIF